ncbi:MAG: hypothetical protein GXX96_38225 [Planctomycetaceae bacterium]|nr:hypothetical protein [Planctomycetaceae bacterium]
MRSFWVFDMGLRREKAGLPPGWVPHMLVFSALGVAFPFIFFFAVFVGIPMGWILVAIGCIDFFAAKYVLGGSIPRIKRMGLFGPTRARWWIEMAAVAWTLCMSLAVFALAQMQLFGPAATGAWNFLLLFVSMTMIGYTLGLLQGKRIRGRAVELVNWFFWWVVGCAVGLPIACSLIPQNPVLVNCVAPALGGLSVIVLLVAAIIALKRRIRNRSRADVASVLKNTPLNGPVFRT